jgi:integrase/recombinase XerD
MDGKIIRLHHHVVNGEQVIALSFPMDPAITSIMKELPGRKWSKEKQWLYVKNTRENLKLIFSKFKNIATIDKEGFFPFEDHPLVLLIPNKLQFRLYIRLPKYPKKEWIDKIRTFQRAIYINKYDLWAIEGGNENYLETKKFFTEAGCVVRVGNSLSKKPTNGPIAEKWYTNKPIDKEAMQLLKKMLSLKMVSESTKKIYPCMFNRFLAYFSGKETNALTINDITDYMYWEIEHNHISANFQNQLINSIKYYYEKALNQPKTVYHLPRAKKGIRVPSVLNHEELIKVFSSIQNLKHRCMISLLFSSGIRRNELLSLRPADVDFERKVLFIHGGKGDKDRISILSEVSIRLIKEYLEKYKPREWLFEGMNGERYSASSIWKIFDSIKRQQEIKKKGSVHILRHSFATSLLESGTDIRYIQSLLGHSSIKTTQIYAHVATNNLVKIKSPMDDLDIK